MYVQDTNHQLITKVTKMLMLLITAQRDTEILAETSSRNQINYTAALTLFLTNFSTEKI